MTFNILVENQREFFKTGKPAELKHRKEQLKRLRQVIMQNREQLCHAVYLDLKRPAKINWTLELSSVIVEIDYMLENLEEWAAPTNVERTFVTMLDKPQIVRQPKGVVLVIGPWNYPLNTLLNPLVTVLAAGNTAILKPSEISAHTADVVYQIFTKAFDKRYLAVVKGDADVSATLLEERFDHIMFTGSPAIGRLVMEAAAKHLTPCTLELGGKCPAIVEPDADLQITARRLVWGKWMNCGQTCLAPDYLLVKKGTKERLVEEMKTVLEDFYGPKPAESKDYSRIINEANFERLNNLLKGSDPDMILYKGGESNESDLFIPPIILDAAYDDPVMQTEIFGPILPIVTINKFEDALEFINKGERPLAAYLFTRDEKKVQKLIGETHSGSVCINDVVLQLTVDTLPFGGIGQSGMGRNRGKFGFDEFTHEKAVLKRMFFGDGIAAGRYPPLTDEKLKSLNQLTGRRRAMPRLIKRLMPTMPYLLFGFMFGFFFSRFYRFGC